VQWILQIEKMKVQAGETLMFVCFLNRLKSIADRLVKGMSKWVAQWTEPVKETLVGGAMNDVARSKGELIAENALLRQQLIVLKRQVKRPRLKEHDRLLLVVLASKARAWRQALLLIKPETLLGWH
jgi:hypothetical protein